MKKNRYLLPIILSFLINCGSDQSILNPSDEDPNVCLYIENDVLRYISSSDIYGFQFFHADCASGSIPGEASSSAGFSISSSSNTVIGFSIMGNYIPSGSGDLLEGVSCEAIGETIISGIGGAEVSSQFSHDCSE